jgi:Uma2 family endonuclease
VSVARQPAVIEDTDLYPNHEEDSVPEHAEHEHIVWTVRSTLRRRLPERWVTGDVCMYWIRGDKQTYRAPDVLVVEHPSPNNPDGVYKTWRDAPALLVIEVGSRSTQQKDEGPKVEIYLGQIGVREYLFFDRLRPRIRMWRLENGQIVELSPGEEGRFAGQTLGLAFGIDSEGRLRIYEADGALLPLPEELFDEAERERGRAEEERLRAELALRREQQARQRAEAERQRAEAERQRAETLEQELERLRAELKRRNDSAPDAGGEVT